MFKLSLEIGMALIHLHFVHLSFEVGEKYTSVY